MQGWKSCCLAFICSVWWWWGGGGGERGEGGRGGSEMVFQLTTRCLTCGKASLNGLILNWRPYRPYQDDSAHQTNEQCGRNSYNNGDGWSEKNVYIASACKHCFQYWYQKESANSRNHPWLTRCNVMQLCSYLSWTFFLMRWLFFPNFFIISIFSKWVVIQWHPCNFLFAAPVYNICIFAFGAVFGVVSAPESEPHGERCVKPEGKSALRFRSPND